MTANRQAWTAFLLSSALIVGALSPVVAYGAVFLYFPVFLMFGCDDAKSGGDCTRILLSPFAPIVLTMIALVWCRRAMDRTRYVTSILVAASACAASWLFVLRSFK